MTKSLQVMIVKKYSQNRKHLFIKLNYYNKHFAYHLLLKTHLQLKAILKVALYFKTLSLSVRVLKLF